MSAVDITYYITDKGTVTDLFYAEERFPRAWWYRIPSIWDGNICLALHRQGKAFSCWTQSVHVM